jgi:hypothetical protein
LPSDLAAISDSHTIITLHEITWRRGNQNDGSCGVPSFPEAGACGWELVCQNYRNADFKLEGNGGLFWLKMDDALR